jgi:hypothetical protein
MRLRTSTTTGARCCSLWEGDSAFVFYFEAHFTVVDNNQKGVSEDRSFSAL